MKKRNRILMIAVIVAVAVMCGIVVGAKLIINSVKWGVSDIRMEKEGDALVLEIDYADCMAYRVESVKEDEIVYRGERPEALDPALGEHCIKIVVCDAPMNEDYRDQHAPWEVYEIFKDAGIRAMWYPNADHGIVIYLGADYPLATEFHGNVSLRNTVGTLFIPIKAQ